MYYCSRGSSLRMWLERQHGSRAGARLACQVEVANTRCGQELNTHVVRLAAGGPGPRLESWAFSVDSKALGILLQEGVFNVSPWVRGAKGEGSR